MNKELKFEVKANHIMKITSYIFLGILGVCFQGQGANLATDNASSPVYTNGWTAGLNGGSGFQPWSFNSNSGTSVIVTNVISGVTNVVTNNIFAGGYIGNSTQNSRDSINSSGNVAFGLYANGDSSAFVSAYRKFTGGALTVGQTFQIDYSQSFNGGNRGINLFSSGAQILNLNFGGGSDSLSFGGNTIFSSIYNEAIRFSFEAISTTQLKLTFTPLASTTTPALVETSATAVVAALPDEFELYYTGGNSGNFEPFFNNISVIPEPSTPLLMGLGLAGLFALRKTRKA